VRIACACARAIQPYPINPMPILFGVPVPPYEPQCSHVKH